MKMGSIFLITIDSFRADRLNEGITPNLWKFAKENVYFKNAITNAPGTPQAFKAMFMSLPPSMAGRTPYIPSQGAFLAEELKKKGCITAGFNSNPYLSKFYNFNRGFEVFEDFGTINKHRRIKIPIISEGLEFLVNSHKDANTINKRATKFLAQNKEDCFLWLHYMDAHYPYAATISEKVSLAKALRKAKYKPADVNENEKKRITKLYDKRINEIDSELGKFIAFLKEEGFYENLFILITADHGDEFGEHGNFFHGHSKLYDEMIRIPLIVKLPTNIKKVVKEQTDLTEISPAIFDKRVPSTKGYVISESLKKDNKGVFSCRTLEWKLIEENGEKELYNLKEDPFEQENLIESNKDIEIELRKIVEDHRKTREGEIEKERVSKEVQRLRKSRKI